MRTTGTVPRPEEELGKRQLFSFVLAVFPEKGTMMLQEFKSTGEYEFFSEKFFLVN